MTFFQPNPPSKLVKRKHTLGGGQCHRTFWKANRQSGGHQNHSVSWVQKPNPLLPRSFGLKNKSISCFGIPRFQRSLSKGSRDAARRLSSTITCEATVRTSRKKTEKRSFRVS